jgi:hypothetical protein
VRQARRLTEAIAFVVARERESQAELRPGQRNELIMHSQHVGRTFLATLLADDEEKASERSKTDGVGARVGREPLTYVSVRPGMQLGRPQKREASMASLLLNNMRVADDALRPGTLLPKGAR